MTRGQHFTPPAVADLLVALALEQVEGAVERVIDPACGDGALLAAVRRRLPNVELVGWDVDPAAAELARRVGGARIEVGDALALARGTYDLVVMNPPYVGEKGNKALFDDVRALGDPWVGRCCARMDYLYLFLHLGLDLLRAGGAYAALTTAYWPAATSAAVLRSDLARRGPVRRWVRFVGSGLFGTAPGQHNLAAAGVAGVGAEPVEVSWQWSEVCWDGGQLVEWSAGQVVGPVGGRPWQPFLQSCDAEWLAGLDWTTRFGDVAVDRQGVVSGCDRLDDEPMFMLTAQEAADRGWVGEWFLQPLLRGSEVARFRDCAAAQTALPSPSRYLLYLDGSQQPPAEVLEHLTRGRARLEARRETRLGLRPWWALHWPRDGELMRRPKLVTARRAPAPCFHLDLDGLAVSSDCTWVVSDGVDLSRLQAALHTPEVARLLQLTGKWKGGLCEFYAAPLRALRLPL